MKNRHKRVISCSSLKPCKKPLIYQTQEVSQKFQISKVGLRGTDQMTCSYSFQDNYNQLQKQLFYKFLSSNHLDWLQIYQSMTQINIPQLLTFVKIGQTTEQIYSNRIIAHYIGLWLSSMGYKEKQNKEKVISYISLIFNQNPSYQQVGSLMYDSLLQGYLPQKLQLKSLLQVCKRGWQYFSFLLCRLIKIVQKANNISKTDLYIELEAAIENKISDF